MQNIRFAKKKRYLKKRDAFFVLCAKNEYKLYFFWSNKEYLFKFFCVIIVKDSFFYKKERMIKMKKLLASLIMLTLIVSSFSVVAFADAATPVEVASWDALETAFAAAPADGTEYTIKFTKDISNGVSSAGTSWSSDMLAPYGTNIVIDLNGHTLKYGGRGIRNTGTITIKNGNLNYISSTSSYYAINFNSTSSTARAKLTLQDVNLTTEYAKGITMLGSSNYGDLVLENTNITSKGIVLYSAGTSKNNTININGGNHTTYDPNGYVVKFQGGIITVNDGTFKNNNVTPTSYKVFNAGQTSSGNSATSSNRRIFFYGGTYPVDLTGAASSVLKSGYYCLKSNVNEYVVEKSVGAAKIGSTRYKTLAFAVSDVAENGEVVLLANNTEAVEVSKLATITKNGFTANVTAGEGYVLKETETAYVVEEAPSEVTVAENITASYDDGKGAGTKTSRFFADINTLDVAEAGFEVSATVEGVKYTWTIALNEVYSTVVANDVTYNATNYIITGAIGDIPNSFEGEFDVKVYTKDFEGNTKYIG